MSKIVLACEIYPPDIGGPASFIKRLTPVLKENGLKITALTYADESLISPEIVKINRRTNLLARYFKYFKALLRLAKQADFIFAQGPLASGLPSALVKKITNIRLIMKVVGDTAWERARNQGKTSDTPDQFQFKKYSWPMEFWKFLRSWAARQADLVIVPSQYLAKMAHNWGVANEKIRVINNSFENRRYTENPAKDAVKKRLGLSGDIILTAGRLAPWKGFAKLIDCLPEFININPDYRLVIAGSGREEKSLKEKAGSLGLLGKVVFAGQIKQEAMADYFLAADLFILNSAYEGLSHALLEALFYKTPVLASNIGGNPEVIKDGFNGLLFDYDNGLQIAKAVRRIYSDKNLAEQFKANGKKVLENFTPAKMNQAYLEILK